MRTKRPITWLVLPLMGIAGGMAFLAGRPHAAPAQPATSLILAEPDFAPNFGDPLWIEWSGDVGRLRTLSYAVSRAGRLGTVKTIAGLQDTFWPLIQLGYQNGRTVPLTWDAGTTVAIQMPNGRWQLLKSPLLARILRNPRSIFSDSPDTRVTAGPHAQVTMRAGNLPGIRALLYANPLNGSGGKETPPAGSVLIARIPIINGQIHWQGTVHTATHADWRLTLIVRPFPRFPAVSGESLGLPLP